MQDYKEFISPENQASLRVRLFKVIAVKKIGITQAARAMSCSFNTIRSFLFDHKDITQFETLMKIDDYVVNNEG